MKTIHRMVWAMVAAALAASPAPAKRIDGAVHLGHAGDVRALLCVGDVLWVGTGDGVYLYDLGADRFVDHVSVGDRLPSNSVRALTSKGDSVLVGTDHGLSVFRGKSVSVLTAQSRGPFRALSFESIRCIDVGRSHDRIYLGTFGRGVGVMEGTSSFAISRDDSLLDNTVFDVYEQNADATYYATSMGLCAYRDSAWVGFQAGAGIPRGQVRAICAGDDDRLYLLVGVGGVYRFDGNRSSRLSPDGVLTGDDVAALVMDARGDLWAAGRFGGIAVRRGGNWQRIGDDDAAIAGAQWRSACASDDGTVCVGSADGRIAVIRDGRVATVQLPVELPSGTVRSFADDGSEVFALCGADVVRLSESGAQATDAPGGLVALAPGGDGVVWGAGRWGVFAREGGAYTEFRGASDAVDPSYSALCVDARGRVWAALRSGAVQRYDGELWIRMGEPSELFDGPIDGLAAGGGTVWAYSESGGVARFDHSGWTVFLTPSFDNEPVRDVAGGAQGAVVVATPSRLWLYRDDERTWQQVEVGEGNGEETRVFVSPPGREIRRVTFDARGNIYLGTDGGLGIVSADGVRWFTAADGLGGSEVADVFVEDDAAVWVGFRFDGVTRIPFKSLW